MAAQVQDLLRFLSQDAKIPLALAMGKTLELQKANLTNPEYIAKGKIEVLQTIFNDPKVAKQVLNAAKRVTKKRGSPTDATTTSPQKRRKGPNITGDSTPYEIESALSLPVSSASEDDLSNTILVTNRAPLVLAFALCVLKYTMPEQPISSRLSLAQAVVSVNSRSKAVSLGIESGKSAEEEGWGEGHPVVRVLGREIRVLKRWDYNPREGEPASSAATGRSADTASAANNEDNQRETPEDAHRMPPLWGVDLEAMRNSHHSVPGKEPKDHSVLPIYTAQSARSYLLRSLSKPEEHPPEPVKPKPATVVQNEKKECVGHLLRAIDLVCQSWASTLDHRELDRRAWAWYLRVRPDVQSGVHGWGEKGQVKLSGILSLRRDP
ncbi:hypothetical protein NUU61_004863 [Penicillium alfredii]|uniref:Impact N-terminal domain-containing protein n=1 Tax=Penicillium alfredii TaxID=1506179 RepID=A0A9W9K802_9EURO|nr:uncharacterized protein NUU61_004863 [Penicillium alfredii]KAJ5095507.1 hypothetical protein NUU61_004863 [Penicillium alfredii]